MTLNRRHIPLAALAAALAAGLTACDPCAGTPSCRDGNHVSYVGRTVERYSGYSVAGTTVQFIRTAGVALVSDTISVRSGSDGFFLLSSAAEASGDVVGTLHIAPAGRPAYDVPGLTLQTSTTNGDGGDLGRLVVDPFIFYVGEVHNTATGSNAVFPYASITFRRTGGITIDHDTIVTQADPAGRFFIAPVASEPGVLQGIFTVMADGFPHPYDVSITIATQYRDRVDYDVHILDVASPTAQADAAPVVSRLKR